MKKLVELAGGSGRAARIRGLAGILFVAGTLMGCAPFDRGTGMTEDRETAPELVARDLRFWADEPAGALSSHLPGGRLSDVLVLSGGGPDGAFGAGVLTGWTDAGTRPEFDVVTGVSIGAIIAPYAFLGPEYDDELEDLVLNRTGKLQRPELTVSGLIFDAGAFERQALSTLVNAILTPDVIARIAEEHRDGRRLFVATTDLDAQRMAVWDIGAMAQAANPQMAEAIRGVFVAAAAIPAAFKPVRLSAPSVLGIEDELHADGGVISQIWAPDPRALRTHNRGRGTTYHIIINNAVEPDFDVINANAASLGTRAITTLIRAGMHADLALTETLLRQSGSDMSLAYIPPDWPLAVHALDFSPEHLLEIYQLGRNAARDGSIWVPRVPNSYRAVP
ncbi:patatin-like phospholipase family protein [Ruegeria sp. HKCCD8929]|uniref:patatin-like phospholipase family protein n=1 Tax=Ruegeria sp. HKCCD8929 TaxID=2683006 RepID=UPI001488D39D|nr:patatin-like phospholipase family protein [Ruegeria sp. HKCCD8929]